ncbi:nuclear transport factor 2 family protein [Actinacidiphila rubida]|uniref:SnoaL-like domain-containing protein n=1 Tax=Actinacidiphila rubida TaxID=310780 RepID=A0A1H8UVN7_9ACTN|nr:nuclear transport factor 2 family protein [Actinacidiphila rubida]SEP07196.1 conserved hypothetical protein [Actinacidiphila rubida]
MQSAPTPEETALRGVLDRWKEAVDRHRPDDAAALFTEEAIFQGLHPYSVGRQGVAEYYASQPLDLAAAYRVVESRSLSPDLVLGYLAVDFSFSQRPTLSVGLSILLRRTDAGWLIDHYQVSLLPS